MKRSVSLLFVFALLLAACGDAEPEQAAEQTTATVVETTTTTQAPPTTAAPPTTIAEPATRTVTHALGTTEIPVEIERLVVLDEYTGVSLLMLGIEPTVVFRGYGAVVSAAILEAEGIPLQDSAMGSVNVNLETVAGFEPDVIVVSNDGIEAIYEDLSAIAPTIVLPFVASWRDVLSATGLYFQKEEEAARVIAAIEERIVEVASLVAEDPMSVSVLGAAGGMMFMPGSETVLSEIVAETGVTRPAAQTDLPPDAGFGSFVLLAAEMLVDHDADEILLLTGTGYGEAEQITNAPTFQSLSAVEAGNVTMVSGEMWFGTFGFAADWILSDIHAIVTGKGAVGTDADALTRWKDFQTRLAG